MREISAEPVPELIHLIDPHKENLYIKKYKIRTDKNNNPTSKQLSAVVQMSSEKSQKKKQRPLCCIEHTIRLHYSEPK